MYEREAKRKDFPPQQRVNSIPKKRVLVLEPNALLRTLIPLFLWRAGHQVMVFGDYEQALQALKHPALLYTPPDIVISAVYRDQQESFQVLKQLRQQKAYAQSAILVLITEVERTSPEVLRALKAVGATSLLKPFSVQQVVSLVETLPPLFQVHQTYEQRRTHESHECLSKLTISGL